MALNSRERKFLPFQVSQEAGRPASFLDTRGNDQALPPVIQHADIAWAAMQQSGLPAPSCWKLRLPFGRDGNGIQTSHSR